jgi:hypothetical protein
MNLRLHSMHGSDEAVAKRLEACAAGLSSPSGLATGTNEFPKVRCFRSSYLRRSLMARRHLALRSVETTPSTEDLIFATVSDDRATDPIFSHLLKAGETVFHNHEHRRCGNELELLRNYSATEENPWHVQLLMRK